MSSTPAARALAQRGVHVLRSFEHRVLPTGRLPDWIILGAMKAGTTTLHKALFRSLQTISPVRKEILFFSDHWDRGLDWYREHFHEIPRLRTGEASPRYLSHPLVPQRIAQTVPDVRLIILLRNPIDRAYSHWGHAISKGSESLSFEAALDAEADRMAGVDFDNLGPEQAFEYVGRGMYATQIRGFLDHFPRNQVLVHQAENLYRAPRSVINETCEWLGISRPLISTRPANVGAPRQEMSPTTRARLAELFDEPNRELEDLLGRRFDW